MAIYAWFPRKSDVHCQNAIEQKTVDGRVTLKGFSIELVQENVKDFEEDLHLRAVDHARHTNKAGVPIASGRPQCLYVK